MVNDGRVLEGSAEQILRQMQYIAFGHQEATLDEYVDWLAGQLERQESVVLKLEGTTGAERAARLVKAMIEVGLARRV